MRHTHISQTSFALRLCILVAAITPLASAQVTPRQSLVGINRPIPVLIDAPKPEAQPAHIELVLASTDGHVIARTMTAPGKQDLAHLFPLVWTTADIPVLYAQLIIDGNHIGPPLVIQPLETPARAEDGLTARVRNEHFLLRELAALPQAKLDELARQTTVHAPNPPVRSGVRLWIDQRIILETDAGEIELALRPDAAPNTCYHFLQLVNDGLYTQVPFHRVIAADAQGRPFLIQSGDPTGTGAGGCGISIDFEPSTLPHDFGVVSMARKPDDPNSASSQFFICLSREACAGLDGNYTAFAQVVRGQDVIATIAATPTGAKGRPIDPPLVQRARTIPAPTLADRTIESPAEPLLPKPTPR